VTANKNGNKCVVLFDIPQRQKLTNVEICFLCQIKQPTKGRELVMNSIRAEAGLVKNYGSE